jgi:hypothetical protein
MNLHPINVLLNFNRTSSTSTGSVGGGKTEIYYDDNVHQDISSLAARTHAEQNSGSYSGNHAGRRRMMSQQDGEPPRTDLVTGVTQLEKVAQGGHGFQTVGLDIGVLGGRNNVDDEMRQQSGYASRGSGSQHSSSSGQNVHYSSGGRTGSSGAHYSSNQGNTQYDEDYEDEGDEYDIGEDEEHDERQGSSYNTQSSFSHSYSSQSDGGNAGEFKHYRRTREVVNLRSESSLCQSAHCVNVRCVVGPLDKNTGALVALRMRLVAHTLHKVNYLNDYLKKNLIKIYFSLEVKWM